MQCHSLHLCDDQLKMSLTKKKNKNIFYRDLGPILGKILAPRATISP